MSESKYDRIRRRILGLPAPRRARRHWSGGWSYGLLVTFIALWTAFQWFGPCGGVA